MEKVASLTGKEREEIFRVADAELNMGLAITEKDFWVCWTLKRIFETPELASKVLFKGGTSLSKCFGLIDRFSEDIDLILDWRLVTDKDPHAVRSNTQQDKFNKEIKNATEQYIESSLLALVSSALNSHCSVRIDSKSTNSIFINYPKAFSSSYIKPEIELEIGALSTKDPHGEFVIEPYCAKPVPEPFENPQQRVKAIAAKKTFWDKITILHAEAHRPEKKEHPQRYSRHYYDLYKMLKSDVKNEALSDLKLLKATIEFKDKFYPQGWANYRGAKEGVYKLTPEEHTRKHLVEDYSQMSEMIFGDYPPFNQILEEISKFNIVLNKALKP